VTLLGDDRRPGGVTLAFTERTGGVSTGDFASLNLGSRCGDDPAAVAENRRLVLTALGADAWADALVCPHQVHGDHVVVVDDATTLDAARAEAEAGSDAVVCAVPAVPVLLCFADCVPVVLAAPGAFAVAHSGWRGTIARIAQKTLGILADVAGCDAADVGCYIGPHIGPADYEVSEDLAERFRAEFGEKVTPTPRHLDLGFAVSEALVAGGADASRICCVEESTASHTDRFFSYRAEGGSCGRHAAIAVIRPQEGGEAHE